MERPRPLLSRCQMLTFAPQFPSGRPPRLLFVVAHSDDIEIGCGGAALRMFNEHPDAAVSWVVFGAVGDREREARASATAFLSEMKDASFHALSFPDAFFPSRFSDIKQEF